MSTGQYMRGFENATNWLLDPSDEAPMNRYYNPPTGLADCAGCKLYHVVENDCPRCQYDLGFTEGSSK